MLHIQHQQLGDQQQHQQLDEDHHHQFDEQPVAPCVTRHRQSQMLGLLRSVRLLQKPGKLHRPHQRDVPDFLLPGQQRCLMERFSVAQLAEDHQRLAGVFHFRRSHHAYTIKADHK